MVSQCEEKKFAKLTCVNLHCELWRMPEVWNARHMLSTHAIISDCEIDSFEDDHEATLTTRTTNTGQTSKWGCLFFYCSHPYSLKSEAFFVKSQRLPSLPRQLIMQVYLAIRNKLVAEDHCELRVIVNCEKSYFSQYLKFLSLKVSVLSS